MKKFLATVILSLILCSAAVAQSNEAVLTGTILDQNDQPVSTASVAVYDSSESKIITGVPSDSTGNFKINIRPGNYVLKVTFLSFKPYTEFFEVNAGETQSFGDITMSPTYEGMDEITVRAESSQMEMSFDKRSFNVGQDITSLGGSAVNVLDNVPSIATDIDGNISLRGNESVRVLINGKPSSMVSGDVDALRSIPANRIKKVEIITNPSSKYAAEGSAGIINIILKKEQERGINGSASVGGGYPEEYEGSVNLNYRTENVNWFTDFGADYRSEPEDGSSFQRFQNPDTTYMYSERTDGRESEIDGDLRLGADFYLSENEVLTASSYISVEEESNNEDVNYVDYVYSEGVQNGDNANVLNRINRRSEEDQSERNLDFNLDYENKIDGDEHKLVADASFDISRETAQSDISQNSSPVQRSEDTEEETDLRFNAEYTRPMGENGKLEAGLRSDSEWMDNDFSVDSLEVGNWQAQPKLTQRFLYSENVNAAFLILGGEFGNFSGQVGVRAENTNIRTEIQETNAVNEQHYFNLFPSVFLNYSFNEQQSVQISYSRRLRRPRSRSLIPFIDYGDPRSQYIGNPALTPEFSNSYEAGYLQYWETGSFLTSFYYRYRTDVIERITEQRNGVRFRSPINFASEKAWGVELSADQDIGEDFSISGNANIYQSNTDGTYQRKNAPRISLSSESQNVRGRMRLQWEIIPDLNYQASMRYRGPSDTPQGSRNGMTMMDSGIAYDLMDGKAKLTFNVRDIFDSRNFNNTVTTDGNPRTIDFYSNSQFSWSTRSFSLNFQYFFGGRQNKNRGG